MSTRRAWTRLVLAKTPEHLIKIDGRSRVVHDAGMAMGTRDGEQEELFVTHQQLRTEGHPYYEAVNKIWAERGFDRFAEAACEGSTFATKRTSPRGCWFTLPGTTLVY